MIPRIREVHLRNYRSIEEAVVRLSDFTVLVGPNGAGKTNFVDALAFVQECLSTSIEAALQRRGGVRSTFRTEELPRETVGFRVIIDLEPETVADYAFELVAHATTVAVAEERCVLSEGGSETHRLEVRNGSFVREIPGLRAVIEPDRLALYAASSLDEFRPVYDFLTRIRTYSIEPEKMREPQNLSAGAVLDRDGRNAAAVLRQIHDTTWERYPRIASLLGHVVPGIVAVQAGELGGKEFLVFSENKGLKDVALFPTSMSDGTLRMLGLLLAVYQPTTPTVLLIEEPEATIHPAASEVVMSVLLDAAKRSQVVVTTHSPDVLDFKALPENAIRVVTKGPHGTAIAPVAGSSRDAIRQRLYSPGELLRADELNADLAAAESLASGNELFGEPVHAFSEDG